VLHAIAEAKYQNASDGHPARVAPTWTQEKLAILACYLHGFAVACKSHPSGWWALDIFAGAGLNISATTGAEIPGSALIALDAGPPFAQRVVVCERGSSHVAGAAAACRGLRGPLARLQHGRQQRDRRHADADPARRSGLRVPGPGGLRTRVGDCQGDRRAQARWLQGRAADPATDRHGIRAHPSVGTAAQRSGPRRRSRRCTGTSAGVRSTSGGAPAR
jgi:hypothetical protein